MSDEELAKYLSGDGPLGLHIGAHRDEKPGWLNADTYSSQTMLYLDATKNFPLPHQSFDYVYSQHMIEHLSFTDGQTMLRECFRVLKPGGAIRIATPSIGFLIGLFSNDKTQLANEYVEWFCRQNVQDCPHILPSFVFNTFVRFWGHRFIYDRQTLRLALELNGFMNPKECEIMQSEHTMLRNLENIDRLPPGFLDLETMIIEAVRP